MRFRSRGNLASDIPGGLPESCLATLKYICWAGIFTSFSKVLKLLQRLDGERKKKEQKVILGEENKIRNDRHNKNMHHFLSHKSSQALQMVAGSVSPTYLLVKVQNCSSLLWSCSSMVSILLSNCFSFYQLENWRKLTIWSKHPNSK